MSFFPINTDIYNNVDLLPEDCVGWNSTNNIFDVLIEQHTPQTIIEVGTWKGASAIKMAKKIKALGLSTKIYCVDTWLGACEFWTYLLNSENRNLMMRNGYPQVYYQFLSNVIHNSVQDIIIPLPVPSSIAWKVLRHYGITADLIYIDASHEYEDVLQDITNFNHLLTPKGIMFGDDYNHWGGVTAAVDTYFSDKNFEVIDNNYWIYKK